jgi:hypothetical protein
MFGEPVAMSQEDAVFHLVWTYAIKTVDSRKKAHCVCDWSTCSGMVCILAETYANCVDQTRSHLFYAISAAKNMLIIGADVSNAFPEAPPPKKGTKDALPSQTVTLFPYFPQCKDTLSLPASGKNMPTLSSVNLDLNLLYMNRAYIRESSTATGSSLNVRSMILLLLPLMLKHRHPPRQDR